MMVPTEFARLMQKEIDANVRKGDWAAWHPTKDVALSELSYHFAKLKIALESSHAGDITHYSADVGNIAMKIAEQFGRQEVQ